MVAVLRGMIMKKFSVAAMILTLGLCAPCLAQEQSEGLTRDKSPPPANKLYEDNLRLQDDARGVQDVSKRRRRRRKVEEHVLNQSRRIQGACPNPFLRCSNRFANDTSAKVLLSMRKSHVAKHQIGRRHKTARVGASEPR